jgi:23S rRNA (guanosine2251-2'-O)-methyltransferase
VSSNPNGNGPKGFKPQKGPKTTKGPTPPKTSGRGPYQPEKTALIGTDRAETSFENRSERFANRSPSRPKVSDEGLIWGVHAVEAALTNPDRPGPLRLMLTPEREEKLDKQLLSRTDIKLEVMDVQNLSRLLPQGAVHQGLALKGAVPEGVTLEDIMHQDGVILMLDQVTDPQNIGAIFRSGAAFGVKGLIFQDRHSPPMQGVLAKTAAGAMDRVPFVRATNLSRALETLNEAGFVSIGLSGDTPERLSDTLKAAGWGDTCRKLVLVLGSEGDGLRRLVAEHCDHLAHIPMPGDFESLNVSHAASISLYEALGRA